MTWTAWTFHFLQLISVFLVIIPTEYNNLIPKTAKCLHVCDTGEETQAETKMEKIFMRTRTWRQLLLTDFQVKLWPTVLHNRISMWMPDDNTRNIKSSHLTPQSPLYWNSFSHDFGSGLQHCSHLTTRALVRGDALASVEGGREVAYPMLSLTH